MAIDDESTAYAGAEGEAGGTGGAFEAACADFAEDVGCGVIEEEHVGGLESEAGGKGSAEIFFIQILELVLHETEACFVIEGAGNG
jgi:hypothetical protein